MAQGNYYPSVYEVLKTSTTKWKWWPSLQLVECYYTGKRKPIISISLSTKNNTEKAVTVVALKEELKTRRTQQDKKV